MFYSIALQITYLKFKRKSLDSKGTIVELIKKKYGQIAKVEFTLEDKTRIGSTLCFFFKKPIGSEVEIFYNPKFLDVPDKSLVINPLLKKMGLKKTEQETTNTILLKQQNPSLYHLSLIIIGLILLTFN